MKEYDIPYIQNPEEEEEVQRKKDRKVRQARAQRSGTSAGLLAMIDDRSKNSMVCPPHSLFTSRPSLFNELIRPSSVS